MLSWACLIRAVSQFAAPGPPGRLRLGTGPRTRARGLLRGGSRFLYQNALFLFALQRSSFKKGHVLESTAAYPRPAQLYQCQAAPLSLRGLLKATEFCTTDSGRAGATGGMTAPQQRGRTAPARQTLRGGRAEVAEPRVSSPCCTYADSSESGSNQCRPHTVMWPV